MDNLPRVSKVQARSLPSYIPYIYHSNRRAKPLDCSAVALPLRRFYRRDGTPAFQNRTEVDAAFGIGPATEIILIGSGRDKAIENWWGLSEKRSEMIANILKLEVALVTCPNYSIFTDEVRYTDLYNMKRIRVAWNEIVGGGVAASYHVNARTSQDYSRIASLIDSHEEITEVSFEFKTGAGWPQRISFHVSELLKLAARVGRPLHLVMIGGINWISKLHVGYRDITYIDTSAFMASMHRQKIYIETDGKRRKSTQLTSTGQPLDGILDENIGAMSSIVNNSLSAAY